MATLDPGIVESVIGSNFKIIAEMGTINALGTQKRLDMIAETATARSIDLLNTTSVPEGLGMAAAQRGDLAKTVADLGSVVAGLQQIVKGAQTTPPVTP